MIYKNYKLEALIPAKKGDFANFDDYYKKILFNLAAHDYKEPSIEMDETLRILYNLDDEVYFNIIKKIGMYYSVFRSNAKYIGIAALSDDPVYTITNMSEMYKIRNSIISRIVGDNFSSNLSVPELHKMADKMIFEESFGVAECKEKFMERTSYMKRNKILEDYANLLMDTNNIRYAMIDTVKERVKTRIADAERKAESGSHARVADSIQKYLRNHS